MKAIAELSGRELLHHVAQRERAKADRLLASGHFVAAEFVAARAEKMQWRADIMDRKRAIENRAGLKEITDSLSISKETARAMLADGRLRGVQKDGRWSMMRKDLRQEKQDMERVRKRVRRAREKIRKAKEELAAAMEIAREKIRQLNVEIARVKGKGVKT